MSASPFACFPLPRGGVALRVSVDAFQITERHQRRFLWFWKRWRTDVLASKPYRIEAGDTVQLKQEGFRYIVSVNAGDPVLVWPPFKSRLSQGVQR